MSTPIPEILQFEKHLEYGVLSLLAGCADNLYHSREVTAANTPRIEVKAITGAALNHAHKFPNVNSQAFMYDAYEGTIEITIATNREVDAPTQTHLQLLGLVRAKLQRVNVLANWQTYQHVILITDIREQGTTDSFIDEQGVDYSVIEHYVLFNVNPDAWPADFSV